MKRARFDARGHNHGLLRFHTHDHDPRFHNNDGPEDKPKLDIKPMQKPQTKQNETINMIFRGLR